MLPAFRSSEMPPQDENGKYDQNHNDDRCDVEPCIVTSVVMWNLFEYRLEGLVARDGHVVRITVPSSEHVVYTINEPY